MPIIDFPNQTVPKGYKPPEPPIHLVEGMDNKEVMAFIFQELYKIYQSNDNQIIKNMRKEDIYLELLEKDYNIENLF